MREWFNFLQGKPARDNDDDDSDDSDDDSSDDDIRGYCRLAEPPKRRIRKSMGTAHAQRAVEEHQHESSNENQTGIAQKDASYQSSGFTKIDPKGKRLHRKLKRREMRRRAGHYLHSTWKWLKRGLSSVVPSMNSMAIVTPVSSVVAQRYAAKRQRRKSH